MSMQINTFIIVESYKKRRCDKTIKNERGGSRKVNESRSIDSEIFELPHSSFVLEPDYADIAKRLRLISQPLLSVN